MVLMFNCCLEGRKVNIQTDGKYKNIDGLNTGTKSRHPFLVLSDKEKIKREKYFTAIPITSPHGTYNQINRLPIDAEMINDKAKKLVKDILRVDAPTRLFKEHINGDVDRFIGEFNLGKTFDKIVLEVTKHMGANLQF
ncbi:hypothetical protein KAT36_00840 [Candidatus Pacearchaeota archaeon]|nr:hypothetical protein [Candidatus Pacearchaeota archaeon]